MSIEKPNLFSNYREFLMLSISLLILVFIRVGDYYSDYKEFITKPFYYTYAKVKHIYPKANYNIIKVETTEGLIIFTGVTNRVNYLNTTIRIKISPNNNLSFVEYINGFYTQIKIKKVIKNGDNRLKDYINNLIETQHKDSEIIEFYKAIFLASKISKSLREKVASLGISHLIALSGLHLTILWSVIYFILLLPYKYFQKRFFSYRNSFFDIGVISIVLLGVYTIFVGSPPSLIRSFIMMLFSWIFLIMGIKIFSFQSLSLVVLIILSLFPTLITSIALWFSIAGVFYIFLIERYSNNIQNKILKYTIFPIGIYLFMLPITHSIFYITNIYQLTSPILSISFVLFYPISIFLHIIGYGGLFDEVLILLFNLPSSAISFDMVIPLDLFVIYLVVSIASIWSRLSFYLLVLLAILNIFLLYNWDLVY